MVKNPPSSAGQQQQQNKHSSQVHMEHSPRQTTFWVIKHTQTNLKETIQCLLPDHNGMELEVSTRKIAGMPKYVEIKQHTSK